MNDMKSFSFICAMGGVYIVMWSGMSGLWGGVEGYRKLLHSQSHSLIVVQVQ